MKIPRILLSAALALAALFSLSSCEKDTELKGLVQVGEEAYAHYKTADYATAKASLLKFIDELERQMPKDPAVQGIDMYKSDIMVSYVRLAKLEEKNNGPEKEKYMQQAVRQCQELKIRPDCSPQALRTRVDRIDELPTK